MKAKLEFDLNDYDDKLAHKRAVSSTDTYIALVKINEKIRSHVKYGVSIEEGAKMALPEGYHTITEKESELLHQFALNIQWDIGHIIEECGVNLDDLP